MSSPPLQHRDYGRYTGDNRPSSGERPPSREDLDNYFDHQLPPPHHLSGSYLSPNHSPRPSLDGSPRNSSYSLNPPVAFGGSGPRYLSPLAAAGATETEGAGMTRNSNYSEMSMVGLHNSNLGANLNRKSTWLRKETTHKRKNHRLFVIVCSILTVLIILAIVVGVVVGQRNKKNDDGIVQSSGTHGTNVTLPNGGNNSSNGGNNNSTSTITGDPSQFDKDPKLKQSFYGIAYTMMNSLYPECHETLASVVQDMQILSQLTTRIRLYGSDCNQTQLVLEAIKQTKVDMKVYVAIFVVVDDDSAYDRQKEALRDAIQTYGVDHIEGVTVGNEFMLNYVNKYGGEGSGVTGAVGTRASTLLREKITDTRQMLRQMGHPNVPVGSADAGSYFNTDLMRAIDFGLSNIHAWFAPTTAAGATQWTNDFFRDNNLAAAEALSPSPRMIIAETGWPTHSSDTQHQNSGAGRGGEASVANLQTFLNDFVCTANEAGTPYFMFEYTDVPWKDTNFGGVEGFWGMFDKDKKLKDLTLPDCQHQ
ncbi:hypothetical protein FRC17_011222 [Serendipita sp. 399]|nr:hypothetical protein FRC17_011222 [Serendipita sp. 399]